MKTATVPVRKLHTAAPLLVTLASTLLLTILGNGATIERNSAEAFRLFYVAAPAGRLTLRDVTLRNGNSDRGGAVYNRGTLILDHSRILSNAVSLNGGGIFNGSTINLDGTVNSYGRLFTRNATLIAMNRADRGGGIYSVELGEITLDDTQIAFNQATLGGGIFAKDTPATLTNVRIAKNSAVEHGGGILSATPMTISDSEVVENSAGMRGGGIFLDRADYPLFNSFIVIESSRLLNNHAPDGGAIDFDFWGGQIEGSCIVGNDSVALHGGYQINATNNWWGAPDGPGFMGPGSGDTISEWIIFSPFLTEPILDCPSVAAGE
jgi:hypothetical protein